MSLAMLSYSAAWRSLAEPGLGVLRRILGKPKKKPCSRIGDVFRYRGRIVFFEEGNDLSIHAAMVGLSREAYSIAQAVGQPHDEFILILRALFWHGGTVP